MGQAPSPHPARRRRRRAQRSVGLPAPIGEPRGRIVRERPQAPRRRRRGLLHWRLVPLGLAAGALLWLSRGWWLPQPPPAQMILVLGGDADREREAARLARQEGLPVVVSGGTNPEYARWLFEQREGVPPSRVRLDYRATDTVTNFTSLVDDLRRARVRHALLVTSSDHMDRALLVGRIVAGSRGIHLTPVPVPCGSRCEPEGRRRVWGDGLRALIWVVSGGDLRHWAEEHHLAPWLRRFGLDRSGPARASG